MPTPVKAPLFGRLMAHDERDKRFLLSAAIAGEPEPPLSRMWQMRDGFQLVQREGSCVGHGVAHLLACAPWLHPVTRDLAMAIYFHAQTIDEWPGEDYEGTSVRAGLKAAQQKGLIGEYRWALTEEVLWRYVRGYAPAVIGVAWMTGMMDPDRYGYVNLTGGEEGGHCTAVIGASHTRQAYRGFNSWAGFDRYWLRREDMRVLLEEMGGEAAAAMEVKPV
jgi:hypothetical protein